MSYKSVFRVFVLVLSVGVVLHVIGFSRGVPVRTFSNGRMLYWSPRDRGYRLEGSEVIYRSSNMFVDSDDDYKLFEIKGGFPVDVRYHNGKEWER